MSDISELEARIQTALGRIEEGLGKLGAKSDAAPDADGIGKALEEEKAVTAQLEARLTAVREKHVNRVKEVEAEMGDFKKALEAAKSEAQTLRATNERLRTSNEELRNKNEEGGVDPHLINKSMMEELAALKKARKADLAEMDALLAEMKPFVKEASDA